MSDCAGELEREKEELTEYDTLDKRRRALQFTLYDKELRKVTSALEGIETNRSEQMQKQQELFARLRTLQDGLLGEEESRSVCTQALDRLVCRREDKAAEVRVAVEGRSELQVELQEVQSSGRAREAALKEVHGQLQEVQVGESDFCSVIETLIVVAIKLRLCIHLFVWMCMCSWLHGSVCLCVNLRLYKDEYM